MSHIMLLVMKQMKHSRCRSTISTALYGLLLLTTTSIRAAHPLPLPSPPLLPPSAPKIEAKSAILVDYHSGKVLIEQQADTPRYPASLVKIMTSYVVGQTLKAGTIRLTDQVTVGANAWGKKFADSSKMFIELGKQVPVADLHSGIIIQSGNDACVALAEHIAGSEAVFVTLMNHYASILQLTNTNFVNVHGLDHTDQYSTARDIARLASALMTDLPHEYALYKEKTFSYNGITQMNRNALLWDSSLNVDGIKTGQTTRAGFNLAASATDGNMRLVAVVLGAPTLSARAESCKKLLQWGFRFFENRLMLNAGDVTTTERVWFGEQKQAQLGVVQPLYLTLPRNHGNRVTTHTVIDLPLKAPLLQHQVVGKVRFELDGQVIDQQPLRVLQAVARGSLLTRFRDTLALWWQDKAH